MRAGVQADRQSAVIVASSRATAGLRLPCKVAASSARLAIPQRNDADERLVGILSERDIVRTMAYGGSATLYWLCKNSTRYNRTRNFEPYGQAQSKETENLSSARRYNQIRFPFSHSQGQKPRSPSGALLVRSPPESGNGKSAMPGSTRTAPKRFQHCVPQQYRIGLAASRYFDHSFGDHSRSGVLAVNETQDAQRVFKCSRDDGDFFRREDPTSEKKRPNRHGTNSTRQPTA
jgi:hypothetical protein